MWMLNRRCLVACRVQLVDSQDPGRRQVTGLRKRLPECDANEPEQLKA